MKKLILFLIVIVVSCQSNQQKKQELSKEEQEFKNYLSLFDEKSLPIKIDSLYIQNFKLMQENEIDTQFVRYLNIKEFKEECGNHKQYLIYPNLYFQIDDKYGLIYHAALNKKCSFDAYYNRFFLGLYNSKGELLDYEEVGARQEVWNNTKLIHSKISDDKIIYKTYTEISGDMELGTRKVVKKQDTLKISIMKGTIK